MEIRWLPRTSRRKTKPASPRGWKYSALIGSRVPQSRAHVWRLGPGNPELERVLGGDGKPLELHSHAKIDAVAEAIRTEGFYRIVLRTREGRICGRRDFQAAWRFSSTWDADTARASYEPRSTTERLAAERDDFRAKLKAAEARSAALVIERDAARARAMEVERNAEIRVTAVRADAAEQVAAAARHREALEALLAERDAELRRVRGLYVGLAEGVGGVEEHELDEMETDDDPEPVEPAAGSAGRPRLGARRRSKDFDLEQLADAVLRIGERLGIVGPAPADHGEGDGDV